MAGPIAINHPIPSEVDLSLSSTSDLSSSRASTPSEDGVFSDVPLSAPDSESAADSDSSETRVGPGPDLGWSSLSDESEPFDLHELDANNRAHSLCEEGAIPPTHRDAPAGAESLADRDADATDGLSEEDLLDAFDAPDAVDRFADDLGFLADVSSGSSADYDSDDSDDYDSDYDSDDYDSDYDDHDYDPEEVEYVSERVTPTVMTLCAITEEERAGLALGLYDISRFMRPAFLTANGEIRDVPEEPAPEPALAPTFGLGLPVPPRASFGRSASFESVNLHDDDNEDDEDEAREDREYDVVRPASPAVRNTSIASPVLLEAPETRPPFFAVDEKDAPLLPISGIATAIATAMREVMGINEPGAVLPDRD